MNEKDRLTDMKIGVPSFKSNYDTKCNIQLLDSDKLDIIANRLAAYEDTGLSPEEVSALKHRAEVAEEAVKYFMLVSKYGFGDIAHYEHNWHLGEVITDDEFITVIRIAEERLKEKK